MFKRDNATLCRYMEELKHNQIARAIDMLSPIELEKPIMNFESVITNAQETM